MRITVGDHVLTRKRVQPARNDAEYDAQMTERTLLLDWDVNRRQYGLGIRGSHNPREAFHRWGQTIKWHTFKLELEFFKWRAWVIYSTKALIVDVTHVEDDEEK